MKQPVFEGVATALVTPFKDGTVDYKVFEQLLDFQLSAGVDAIVICGTTGEASTMESQEQLGAIAHAIKYTAGRCKIIAGTGSNNTAHAIQMSRVADSMGADALLLVTPYYNKCTQTGLVEHFYKIADAVNCPAIVYSVPGRTGVEISVETCNELSQHPRINGIKEAGIQVSKVSRIINTCQDDFYVWSGNDDQIVPMMSVGAKGVISVLSNAKPKEVVQMTHCILQGDFQTARMLQNALIPLIDALFSEVNPIPIKKAMSLLGFDVGIPRLPLTELSEKNTEILKTLLSL